MSFEQQNNDINELKHGEVQLRNGITIHYVEKGDATGIPVIFIHGFPDSWNSFRLVLNEIAPQYHSFALDLRGFGDSSKPDSGFSIKDFSEDVVAFLDTLKIKKAVLVGHSMGSFVVQRIAVTNSDRVDKLVLIGSSYKGKENDVLLEALEEVGKLQILDEEFITLFQSSTTNGMLDADFFHSIISESLKSPLRVWKQSLKALTEVEDLESGAIRKKTLIAWGTKDVIFSKEEQHILLDKIPGASIVVYEDAGHSLNWEKATIFTRDLELFITEKAF